MRLMMFAILAPGLLLSACSKAPTTNEFLTKAIRGDNSEMRLGTLAATKGGPAVAAYGHTLEADHSKAREAAIALAGHYGITPPSDILPAAEDEERKLEKLGGIDFDKEFTRYMVKDHEEDIADFKKEAESDAPADVRRLALSALPDLQKHLDMAKGLK